MKEIHLKGRVTRIAVVKNTLILALKPRFILSWMLMILAFVLLIAYLLPESVALAYKLPPLGWNHMIFLAIVFLLILMFGVIWNALMENSRLKAFDCVIEYWVSEDGISQKLSWDGVKRNTTIEWSKVQTISEVGPLITFSLTNGRSFGIFPSLFESQAQREEVLNLLRQKAEEHLIATRGF